MNRMEHLGPEEFRQYAEMSLSPDAAPQDGTRALKEHLAECAECTQLSKIYEVLVTSRRVHEADNRGADCIPEPELYRLAAGVVPQEQAQSLMRHASQCTACSLILRQAIGDLGTEENKISPVPLTALKSSSSEWQNALAAQMAAAAQDHATPTKAAVPNPHRMRSNLLAFGFRSWGAIAAVALASVAAYFFYQRQHNVEHLMIAAYNEHRPSELRIPGGSDVRVYSPARGGGADAEGPELLRAKLRAEEGLHDEPQSGRWNEAAGQVALIEQNWESALTYLQLAQLRDPSLARVEFDLGVAYFERAEDLKATEDYARAVESFTKYMKRTGQPDAVSLFNRAICFELMGMKEDALSDLNAAKTLELDPTWKREIQTRIDALNAGRTQSLLNPEAAGDRYETRLANALSAGQSMAPDTWQRLAEEGARHSDDWASDWLKGTDSRQRAAESLATAVRDNRAGSVSRALEEARKAATQFGLQRDGPGRLRALAEEALAAQRMGKATDCLNAVRAMRHSRELSRSTYLQAFAWTEESICVSMQGSLEEGRILAARASVLAGNAGLIETEMRARGMLAAFISNEGLVEQAWRLNVANLISGGDAMVPGRRYQFLSDMTLDAVAMDLPEVAAFVAEAGRRAALLTKNEQNIAYSEEILGERLTVLRRLTEAEKSFEAADISLSKLGETVASQVFRADWASNRAELTASKGSIASALTDIRTHTHDAGENQDVFVSTRYWTHRARIELLAGELVDAERSGRKAVALAASGLVIQHGIEGREAWLNQARPAYQVLVGALLREHNIEAAFETWLEYRAAVEESPSGHRGVVHLQTPHAVTLVYARLSENYVVFAQGADEMPVKVWFVDGSAAQVDQLARSFSLLCSDRRSSEQNIADLGHELYNLLVGPTGVDDGRQLRIDASGGLSSLPFAAFRRPNGHYLGSEKGIVELPKFWTALGSSDVKNFSDVSRIEIAKSTSKPHDPGSRIPSVYDEAPQIATHFRRVHITETSELTREQLFGRMSNVDIFHFEGHTTSSEAGFGLILNAEQRTLLTAQSLVGVRLSSRLVVLAACQSTGAQEDEVEPKLEEAFLRSGVHEVLASKWSIDSEATHILILAFYGGLAKGKDPAAALRSAQADIRTSFPGFTHPFYWAGFSLIAA